MRKISAANFEYYRWMKWQHRSGENITEALLFIRGRNCGCWQLFPAKTFAMKPIATYLIEFAWIKTFCCDHVFENRKKIDTLSCNFPITFSIACNLHRYSLPQNLDLAYLYGLRGLVIPLSLPQEKDSLGSIFVHWVIIIHRLPRLLQM